MTKIIDGKKIANEVTQELRTPIAELAHQGIKPNLSVVLVGSDPASQIYVRMKTRKAEQLGIESDTIVLDAETRQEELIKLICELNENTAVHGILVQLPLPSHIDEDVIINCISPDKDVDGFHPLNRGRLLLGADTLVPCTPLGIQHLLVREGVQIPGQHVVIMGRSKIVGLPLATMLVQKNSSANATVTICHTRTQDLESLTRQADILIAAAGKPEIIKGSMIKSGAVVIDVGVNRIEDPQSEKGYRIVGDVEFSSASKVAGAISPVPGGVGPMTIAMLMHNTVQAAVNQSK